MTFWSILYTICALCAILSLYANNKKIVKHDTKYPLARNICITAGVLAILIFRGFFNEIQVPQIIVIFCFVVTILGNWGRSVTINKALEANQPTLSCINADRCFFIIALFTLILYWGKFFA